VALAGLAGGGGMALVAAQPTWVTATESEVGYATGFAGSQVAAGVVACALVALAGTVGVIATRGVVRRLVGSVLLLVGLVLVVVPVGVVVDPAGAVRHPLSLVAGGADTAPRMVTVAWWWCVLAALGGVAVVGASALTVLRASGWPVMASRYERPGGRRVRPADAWTQLDQGLDPTADPPADPAPDLPQ
jgi:Tryptophan-associated transmembrane protein (Trp_oprn_chp)